MGKGLSPSHRVLPAAGGRMTSPQPTADQLQVSTAKKINGSGFIFILSNLNGGEVDITGPCRSIEHSIQNGTDRRPLYDEARFSGKIREKMWVCWDDSGCRGAASYPRSRP